MALLKNKNPNRQSASNVKVVFYGWIKRILDIQDLQFVLKIKLSKDILCRKNILKV